MSQLVSNPDQFIRIPGHKPTPFREAVTWPEATPDQVGPQAWDVFFRVDPKENNGFRTFSIKVTEDLYEFALYARATRRYAEYAKRRLA